MVQTDVHECDRVGGSSLGHARQEQVRFVGRRLGRGQVTVDHQPEAAPGCQHPLPVRIGIAIEELVGGVESRHGLLTPVDLEQVLVAGALDPDPEVGWELRHRQVEHLVDVGQPSVGTGRDVGPDPLREQCTGQDSGFRRLQPPGPPERVLRQFGPILDRVGQQQRHRQLPFDLAQQHDAPMLRGGRVAGPGIAASARRTPPAVVRSVRIGRAKRPGRCVPRGPASPRRARRGGGGRARPRPHRRATGGRHRNGVGGAEPVRGRSWRVLWRCRCRRWQASGRTAPRPGPMLPPPARRGPRPTQIRRQPRVDRARRGGRDGRAPRWCPVPSASS